MLGFLRMYSLHTCKSQIHLCVCHMSNKNNGKCFILSWLMPLLFWHVEVAMFSPSIFTIQPAKILKVTSPTNSAWRIGSPFRPPFKRQPTSETSNCHHQHRSLKVDSFEVIWYAILIFVCKKICGLIYFEYVYIVYSMHIFVVVRPCRGEISYVTSFELAIFHWNAYNWRVCRYAYLGLSKHYAPRNR